MLGDLLRRRKLTDVENVNNKVIISPSLELLIRSSEGFFSFRKKELSKARGEEARRRRIKKGVSDISSSGSITRREENEEKLCPAGGHITIWPGYAVPSLKAGQVEIILHPTAKRKTKNSTFPFFF